MKYIKIYFVLFTILIVAYIFQTYYNYQKLDTFKVVKIYNYYAKEIMIIENKENLILFNVSKDTTLVVYKTKYVIMKKEKFNLLKHKNDYELTITFTEEFLEQM
jgi:hypothetical protein